MSEHTRTVKKSCEHLRVVLLCKGKGADKDSYRPRSDESQWWGRRDALVRCAASFLFGAESQERSMLKTRKELVFLFDEDLSRLHMTIDDDDEENPDQHSDAFPKEETIIKLWKQAAQNLRKEVKYKGIKCTIRLDPTLSFAPSQSTQSSITKKYGSSAPKSRSIERIDTKREVLEYIQQHCSIEFLRDHRINSNSEVVLRKTNRKALLKIWATWTEQMQESSLTNDGKGNKSDEQAHFNRSLETIYKDLLKFPVNGFLKGGTSSGNDNQIFAGTLHESSEEFPCFRFRQEETTDQSLLRKPYQICLFLGGVRDMTSSEEGLLKKVCEASNIPFVGIRFGTVPEFTSKILSLLAFHHANRVLGISMTRLLNSSNQIPSHYIQIGNQQQSTCLNIICTIPKTSKDITVSIAKRDHIHWRLVRVMVCSLWRSKLVSSNSQVTHTNILHLVFDDGIVITLTDHKFVGKLAIQHQAAPTEFQILTALVQEIDQQSKTQKEPPTSSKSGGLSEKKIAKRLLRSILKSSPIPVTCTVGIESNATNELVALFYNHSPPIVAKENAGTRSDDNPDYSILMVIDIETPPGFAKPFAHARQPEPGLVEGEQEGPREIYLQILSASRKLEVPTTQQRLLPNNKHWCWDREAASIIAVQHMCYQNRVFARWCSNEGKRGSPEDCRKKRKKPC